MLTGGEKLALKEANLERLGEGLEAMAAALEQSGDYEKAAVLRATLTT